MPRQVTRFSWHALVTALALLVVVACNPSAPSTPSAPSPQAWPSVPGDEVEELPPIARLALADGSVHAGELGSFAYRETFADAPWIGAGGLAQINAPAGRGPMTVALLPGNSFTGWSISYAAAADPTGDVILPLSAGSGEAREQAQFDSPLAGEWVIQVLLTFPDDDGDAVYYWNVVVP